MRPWTQPLLDRLDGTHRPRVLEIGVKEGDNALGLLKGREDLVYVGIDHWRAHHLNRCPKTIARLRSDAKVGDRATIMVGESVDALRLLARKSFALVFIDGDHSYEGCRRDIMESMRMVMRGGWLCGHDYGYGEPKWRVREAVQSVFRDPSVIELGSETMWYVRATWT